MYEELLKKLGLDDKEIKVFLTVLERVRITPALVSQTTGINRSTVYSVGKELEKKGLLVIDTASEPAYFVVESPSVLENIIKSAEYQLGEQKKVISEAVSLLENLPKTKSYSVPNIRFYNERQIEEALYRQTPIWFENAVKTGEKEWWGFEDATWVRLYPEWVKFHWENAPEGIGARFITDDRELQATRTEQEFDERRQIKFINPDNHSFTANQVVLGDYIIYIRTNEKPYYMIEIHDRVMAHNLREVFKLVWGKL